ncbi:MAG TPA: spore germination protein [Candidatus Blautia pullicola]|uniref:Spore germination protein n=1 Tax=Candidatus Blautia pullicola TaxID=2838498 RepID=A0A9D2FQT1_9FIRM|nr:spore germination protein [Candidatus Blautia pullicola]
MEHKISCHIEENEAYVRQRLKDCDDFIIRPMLLGEEKKIACLVVYIEVAVSNMVLEDSVIGKLVNHMWEMPSDEILEFVRDNGMGISDVQPMDTMEKAFAAMLAGNALFFLDGYEKAIKVSSKGYPNMGVSEASREKVLRGSKEGFSDVVKTNSALVRKRIRDTRLKVKQKTLGERSQTVVQILYMEDLVRPGLVEDIERKLDSFVIDGVLDSGVLEQMTEKSWLSPFPQFQTTERPDKCSAEILNGRVVVLTDHSPMALILPAVFNDFLQVSEDYYNRFEIVSLQRLIRYAAVLFTLLFSAAYLAVTNFHTQVLPTNLILSFSQARQGVPFPGILEVLLMELAFETIREAGVRMPGPLGGTIGIVGGLIVGQAAVEANLVSPIVVVVVAVTALCSLAIPNEEFTAPFRLLKFAFILLGGTLGMFGMILGLYLTASHLAGLKSFGIPYLSPFGAQIKEGFRGEEDGMVRFPLRFLKTRPVYAKKEQQVRLKETETGGQAGKEGKSYVR